MDTATEQKEEARLRLSTPMLQALMESNNLDTVREILGRNPDLFYDKDIKTIDTEVFEKEREPKKGPLKFSLAPSLIGGALKAGNYGQALVLTNRHKDSFDSRDLESVVTLAIEGIGANHPRCAYPKTRVQFLVKALLKSDSFLDHLYIRAPRIAAAIYHELDHDSRLFDLEDDRPFDMLAFYQDIGSLTDAMALARSLLEVNPLKVIQTFDHLDRYQFRMILVDEVVSSKSYKSVLKRDNDEPFAKLLSIIGSPSMFDNDELEFQKHLYMQILTASQATEPWTAYRAAKYIRSSHPDLFDKIRSNLITKRVGSDPEDLLDEFLLPAENREDAPLLELAEAFYSRGTRFNSYDHLKYAIECIRAVKTKLNKPQKKRYNDAIFRLCEARKYPDLSQEEFEKVTADIAATGNPFTAYQMIKDAEPTPALRRTMHNLSYHLITMCQQHDLAFDAEMYAQLGAEDPSIKRFEEIMDAREEHDKKIGYVDIDESLGHLQ